MCRKKYILSSLYFSLLPMLSFFLKNIGKFLRMFLLFISVSLYSQITFEALPEKMKENPKPIVLYIDSDYCAYCAIQQKQLQKDKKIQDILALDFYFVTLNSEQKSPVVFNQQTYGYNTLAEAHQLACLYAMENGKIATPTWIIFSKEYTPVFKYNGLINTKDLQKLLENFTEK